MKIGLPTVVMIFLALPLQAARLGKALTKLQLICLFTLSLGLIAVPPANASTKTCRDVFTPEAEKPIPDNMLRYYDDEIRSLSKKAITKLNLELLDTWTKYRPSARANRAPSITTGQLRPLIESARKNEVTGIENKAMYAREGTEIGYCFGRATYFHDMLLKMGLQEESMRKVWITGPTRVPGETFNWDYHVALMVYTSDAGWVTLDTAEFKPLPIRYWMQQNFRHSTDKRARFYVTSASKFNVQFGKYSRVQMGLDLSREDDWFRGYFKDVLALVRDTDLAQVGITPLARAQATEEPAAKAPPERQALPGPRARGAFYFLFD